MWKRQTATAFLLQEAYSFFATNANPSLLWNIAAISYDKINENVEAPVPKHAWQKHVLFFPVILHLSTLTTICLHAFHWLFFFKDRVNLFQKKSKISSRKLHLFLFCIPCAGMTDSLPSKDLP